MSRFNILIRIIALLSLIYNTLQYMQVPKISQNIGHNLGIRKLKCSDEIGSLHPTPTKQNNTTWKTNKQTKN